MKRFFAIVSAAALAATTLATPANAQTSVDTVEAQYNKYGKCTNCVALTYDDGPAPGTARLLDILRERGVTASFFLVGKKRFAPPVVGVPHARRGAHGGEPHLQPPSSPPRIISRDPLGTHGGKRSNTLINRRVASLDASPLH